MSLTGRAIKVEELGHVEHGEHLAHDGRSGPAVGVVNDSRSGEPYSVASRLKRAAAGSKDVLDPICVPRRR